MEPVNHSSYTTNPPQYFDDKTNSLQPYPQQSQTPKESVLKEEQKEQPAVKSLPSVSEVQKVTNEESEKQDLANKTGAMWTCVRRIPDPQSKGYLYEFRLKPEYDYITPLNNSLIEEREEASDAMRKKIFPAIEPTGDDVTVFTATFNGWQHDGLEEQCENQIKAAVGVFKIDFDDKTITEMAGKLAKLEIEMFAYIKELGYKFKSNKDNQPGVTFILPDLQVLMTRYQEVQKKFPNLPKINIVSGAAIAGDLEFFLAHLEADRLLSSGKEFVHDHINHIMPFFQLLLQNEAIMAHPEKYPFPLRTDNLYQFCDNRLKNFMKQTYAQYSLVKEAFQEGRLFVNKGSISKKDKKIFEESFIKIEKMLGVFADTNSVTGNLVNYQVMTHLYYNQYKNDFGKFIKLILQSSQWKDYLALSFAKDKIHEGMSAEKVDKILDLEKKDLKNLLIFWEDIVSCHKGLEREAKKAQRK